MTKKIYIETYGCQMNFSDSEIVLSIMNDSGYQISDSVSEADVVFLNTCSVRDNAEQRVLKRLKQLKSLRAANPGMVVGVLGCMAERMKESLLEEANIGMRIDLVAGPDAYRNLPELIREVESGQKAINVILSTEETYADVTPVRYASNGVSAFISIMRGCENLCSYCVVPGARGKERSRDPETIISEAKELYEQGYREITLLGQNVNSYLWKCHYGGETITFPRIIEKVAGLSPSLRIRFATSHPKDLSDELIETIGSNANICRSIHLPVQSGSNAVLKRMNRKYTVESYMERIAAIRKAIPQCSVTTDIIAGFCGENEEDHRQTLKLMEEAKFDFAYMFRYSERPGTPAERSFTDDVPEDVKKRRLEEIIGLQRKLSHESNKRDTGKVFEVLVEGVSRKSEKNLMGRNSQNKVVVFKDEGWEPGTYVNVKIKECTSATLLGEAVDQPVPLISQSN